MLEIDVPGIFMVAYLPECLARLIYYCEHIGGGWPIRN